MCINATPDAPITADCDPLDLIEEFSYQSSFVAKDNAAQKDIKARLGKARGSFARLQPVWKSKQYRAKPRLNNSTMCQASSAVWLRVPESGKMRFEQDRCLPQLMSQENMSHLA